MNTLTIVLSDIFFITTVASLWLKDTVYVLIMLFTLPFVLCHFFQKKKINNERKTQKEQLTKIEDNYQLMVNSIMRISQELQFPLKLAQLSIKKIMNGQYSEKEHETILHSTNRMLVFISDLLYNQNKNSYTTQNNLTNVNISRLLKQLLSVIEEQNGEKHIIITYNQSGQDITMDVDRMKMTRMIFNLYFYASKYTNGSGYINIHFSIGSPESTIKSPSTVYVKGSLPEHCDISILKIHISSNAIESLKDSDLFCKKMNDEEVEKNVELSVIQDIILSHKGMIIINNKKRKNQDITVALPIYNNHLIENSRSFNTNTFTSKQSNSKQPNSSLTENLPYSKLENINTQRKIPSLLVITNDTDLQNVLKEELFFSYDIHFTNKMEEGLKMCTTLLPDILICDITMPQIDGIKMCKQIKRDSQFAKTSVALLSDDKSAENRFEGYEVGADLYLLKPFSIRLLEAKLQRLLSQKKRQAIIDPSSYKNICEYTENDKRINVEALFSPEERKRMINKLKQIIEEHIDDPNLSSKQLSIELGISRSKLYRELKTIDGLSLANYIRSIRLERARDLLIHSDHTPREITEMIGFVNLSHFSRVFKEKYNMTPGEYKRKNTRLNHH